MSNWERTGWPYSDKMDSDVYSKKLSGTSARAMVYIRDEETYPFTVSDRKDGNGEYAFSGSFCKVNIKNIEEAMEVLDIHVPSYLNVPRYPMPHDSLEYKSLEECLDIIRGTTTKKIETKEEKASKETAKAAWTHMTEPWEREQTSGTRVDKKMS